MIDHAWAALIAALLTIPALHALRDLRRRLRPEPTMPWLEVGDLVQISGTVFVIESISGARNRRDGTVAVIELSDQDIWNERHRPWIEE